MSSRRTLILIAAIAVGALAAFAIFNYVGGIEDRANEDVQRVSVIRITQDIPQGLTGFVIDARHVSIIPRHLGSAPAGTHVVTRAAMLRWWP